MIDLQKQFREYKICAIFRGVPLQKTLDYGRALYNGGIRMFEVATNSADAYEQIRILRKSLGEDALIGAGTVITGERCRLAFEAGAGFFLTPSVSENVFAFCVAHGIGLLPGVMTPSDVAFSLSHGCQMMKLFPAGAMPKGYIRQLKGPFDDTEYVAVGGVSPENVSEFFAQGYIGAGIGSSLVPAKLLAEERWDEIEASIKKMMGGLNAQ